MRNKEVEPLFYLKNNALFLQSPYFLFRELLLLAVSTLFKKIAINSLHSLSAFVTLSFITKGF